MAAVPQEAALEPEPVMASEPSGAFPWRTIGLVAGGGALGALLRSAMDAIFPVVAMATLVEIPWATLVVNTVGCLALGVIAGLAESGTNLPHWVQPFLVTGVIGGFTTMALVLLQFSAMIGVDVPLQGLAYAAAGMAVPIAAVALGLIVGRIVGSRG